MTGQETHSSATTSHSNAATCSVARHPLISVADMCELWHQLSDREACLNQSSNRQVCDISIWRCCTSNAQPCIIQDISVRRCAHTHARAALSAARRIGIKSLCRRVLARMKCLQHDLSKASFCIPKSEAMLHSTLPAARSLTPLMQLSGQVEHLMERRILALCQHARHRLPVAALLARQQLG